MKRLGIIEIIRAKRERMRERERNMQLASLQSRFMLEEINGSFHITFDGVAITEPLQCSIGVVEQMLFEFRYNACHAYGRALAVKNAGRNAGRNAGKDAGI